MWPPFLGWVWDRKAAWLQETGKGDAVVERQAPIRLYRDF